MYYHKYKAKKVKYNNETFDSKKELSRYLQLLDLQEQGDIHSLARQVEFELIPTQREPDTINKRGKIKKGKTLERSVKYIADFVYITKNNEYIVEDVKGIRTKEYIIKRKLMLYLLKIKIKEI